MADPYGKVKAGRLTFKGGEIAIRSKSIDKKLKKKKKKPETILSGDDAIAIASEPIDEEEGPSAEAVGEDIYTIDAAKKMKYDELFPVEAKKFGYDPKAKELKSVEDKLDDRVKKKADRYCK
ncbi:Long-chain-aldehyde dehydrogenase [Heracleum sosnowskyi]|uniref:Long-chain-aldehyde dehydrogenase n=1 Tax=Heracleum sosnowskyi TaxID=360622 RepID=A0AAD8JJ83_9APIA|nr:Long-chain-aldehyde dehydrogenase [Heracleum sosnowskyi]